MKQAVLLFLVLSFSAIGGDDFSIHDCVIKKNSNRSIDILRIVSVQENVYLTFSYFLSEGNLVEGQDYSKKSKLEIHKKYSKVSCPKHENSFNPEKYIDKNS
jgi:hypothetical protein